MAEQNPPETDRTGRRKQARRTVFVFLVMAGAVALAWGAGQVVRHVLVSGYRPPAAPRRPGPTSRPDDAAFDTGAPMAAAGLTSFRGDPAGVRPPRGARRLYGVQRVGEDEIERQAHYRVEGSPDAAARHYEAAMKAAGFQRLKDSSATPRRRVMVFAKRGDWVTVSLLTRPGNVKMVDVVVVAVEPMTPASTKR